MKTSRVTCASRKNRKKNQQALIDYIKKSDVSKDKKKEWREFLLAVWDKYPLNYVKKDSAAVISAEDSTKSYSLTKSETETFEEIHMLILSDMQGMLNNQVSVKWAEDVHKGFIAVALQTEDLPPNLKSKAIDSADDPDDWYAYPGGSVVHCIEHGYIVQQYFPTITGEGLAPLKTDFHASAAKVNFLLHNYEEAFTDLGYSSHFITDLGNPYHTPQLSIASILYL